jgi:hypothetical protein
MHHMQVLTRCGRTFDLYHMCGSIYRGYNIMEPYPRVVYIFDSQRKICVMAPSSQLRNGKDSTLEDYDIVKTF